MLDQPHPDQAPPGAPPSRPEANHSEGSTPSRWAHLEKVEPTPPPAPAVLVAEHEVEVEELPRGAKAVARKVTAPWRATWLHVVSEELENPKRGGESFGLKLSHPDGRNGWATWLRGKFDGAVIYDRPGGLVPRVLKAGELKHELAHETQGEDA